MLHFIQGVLACVLHHLSQRKLHSLKKETQADNLWGKQLRAHSPESQEYFVSAQGEKQDGWWITGTHFSVHLERWGWSSVNFKSWLRSLISGRVKHQGSSQRRWGGALSGNGLHVSVQAEGQRSCSLARPGRGLKQDSEEPCDVFAPLQAFRHSSRFSVLYTLSSKHSWLWFLLSG